MDGSVLQVRREKDKPYLYTANPSHIHHKSNKIDHQLKIVDFYIQNNCPDNFVIEPLFGTYEPDIFFKDKSNNHICVEIQITPISLTKMQTKLSQFVEQFDKEHDSKVLVICSNTSYNKLKLPSGFRLMRQPLPKEMGV